MRRQTRVSSPWLCPELRLHLVDHSCPWWRSTPAQLSEQGIAEPFWAFAWAGGQAMARLLLDRPELARGRRVLDLGAGGAVAGIAAARAGAAQVLAADIDPLAGVAAALNASLNDVALRTTSRDLLGTAVSCELLLAADMSYEAQLTGRLLAWLGPLAERGCTVLLADPGRGFLPQRGLQPLACYDAPADNAMDGSSLRPTPVYRLI